MLDFTTGLQDCLCCYYQVKCGGQNELKSEIDFPITACFLETSEL